MQHPQIGAEVRDLGSLAAVQERGIPLLVGLLELAQEDLALSAAKVLEHWRGTPESEHLARLLAQEGPVLSREDAEHELRDVLHALRRLPLEQRIDELLAKAGQGLISEAETREMTDLQKRLKGAG
jgi:DNA primase